MNHNLLASFKSVFLLIVALLGLLAISEAKAWDPDLGGNQYNAPEARRYQQVQVGVVEDIREVVITRDSQTPGYIGGAIGAILGGVTGNSIGNGRGRAVAAALGGTLGAIGGKLAGDYVGHEAKRSAEIIVVMKNGNVVAVVQELDGETAQLQPGDRVRLIEGQAVRVVKLRGNAV